MILKYKKYLIIPLFLSLFSCIREEMEVCEQIVDITIKIQDSKYFNEAIQTREYVFSDFIESLNYEINNTQGVIMKQTLSTGRNVTGTRQDFSFRVKGIEAVKYDISLWGNIPVDDNIQILHPDNKEGLDLFTTNDVLEVIYPKTQKIFYMQRVKGKIRVHFENIPTVYEGVMFNISNLYKTADSKLNYSDITSLSKSTAIQSMIDTYVAPSVTDKQSILEIHLTDGSGNSYRFSDVPVKIRRNEITELKIKYTETNWEVLLRIDGSWEAIPDLVIQL